MAPPSPPTAQEPGTPRVVELLRKAIEWQALLDSGEVANQAGIAQQEGSTRARVTQFMGMLRLSPENQQHILATPETIRCPSISERMLRPLETITDYGDQIREFHKRLV